MPVNTVLLSIVVLIYLMVIFYLGWLGYQRTSKDSDYMVAGRNIHPFILALSYGATFISTAAIVGFGGVAGSLGLGLLWLVFLNIFVGIFIAFAFFGPKTREMGSRLNAVTFPELLGKRFNSKFIQGFSGALIGVFMPLYAGIVLIGAARFIETALGVNYDIAVLIFAIIVAAYVITGGLIAVMYTDALQGFLMFIGMAILLVFTYNILGGISQAHQRLTDMAHLVPEALVQGGHQGWTMMPEMGSPIWWTMVSTIILGVGIGVLAQPQLAVRFMTVESNKSFNRAIFVGGPFILMMTGVAFIVGSLSNVYFYDNFGQLAIEVAGGNTDLVIPAYINSAMPDAFVILFMLVLLAASMSTLSSQYHTMGTSIGHDVYREYILDGNVGKTVTITRIGIAVTILISVILAYLLPISIIARATAIFFGLCAAAFLPIYIGALFWKRMNKQGAIAGLVVGSISSLFWLTFVHEANAVPLGISQFLTGNETIISGTLTLVDPILIATPLAGLAAIVITLITPPPSEQTNEKCEK